MIKATAAAPEPLEAPLHTAFIQVERGQAPATSVRVAPVSTRGRSATWRIDLEVDSPGTDVSVVLPRAERRVLTPALRKRVRGRARPDPFRPKWTAQTFVPIPGPRIPRTRVLRRGKDLDPLFIFPRMGASSTRTQTIPGAAEVA
jgi:hypothetical protein